MKKQEKQLINEWLDKLYDELLTDRGFSNDFELFKKKHNLIDDELEVGKWYKNKILNGTVYFIHAQTDLGVSYYGLNHKGEWSNEFLPKENFDWLIEVEESYVIERLTWYAEQVMKYNHEKPNYKCLYRPTLTKIGNITCYELDTNNEFWVKIGDNYNLLMSKGVWATTFEVEKPIKAAYKSKGGEHGKRIIDKLVELGGINEYDLIGIPTLYYYTNNYGYVYSSKKLPQGYTECFLEEEVDEVKTITIPTRTLYNILENIDSIKEQIYKLI